ncbi:MAG: hypothetical protein ACMXYE_00505 [Candidatus Woesearchaeota archaeon]
MALNTSIKAGLAYPWQKPVRLWNILWLFVPIFGWLALYGYLRKIDLALVDSQYEYPAFGSPLSNFVAGLKFFIFMIPTFIVLSVLDFIPLVGSVLSLLFMLIFVPWLILNYFVKDTFSALWELDRAFKVISEHGKEYVIVLLKTYLYIIVYVLLSLVIIGIPGLLGSYYYLADFYRKYR